MTLIFLRILHFWDRLSGSLLRGRWALRGFDAFAGDFYPLPGRYLTEAAASRAARLALLQLEKQQPSAASGGQAPGGLQDRIFIVRPDGISRRYLPEA